MTNLKEGYAKQAIGKTKRYCQFLTLNPQTLAEYKHWHTSKNIWKEIPVGIRKAGILDMEIYVLEELSFMILTTSADFDWDEAFGRLATYERQTEWEDFTSTFQQTVGQGQRSEEKWQLVERIFSLTEALKLNE